MHSSNDAAAQCQAAANDGDWDDTFALYRRLISSNEVYAISEIEEFGRPWIQCESQNADGSTVSHSLAIDDGGWGRVD
ncbi:hypothetical protein K227x_17060 [Rubripirellula lacrimiformis]|uniref:Uncharacterized protein n=1 Tax=Rubripirellula lacrimiformis TaxID=1930273 RepID=A0A517N859_9BACT|nr:hypothetical protein [Rubripirellula lacrimiformis]QDT03324.1 hypothetical protein K227x_17060 [Rubripirellula lacrimiformis]